MSGTAILCNWWNHPELLDGFCQAVSGEGWDELVVVDNASEPAVARRLVDRIGAIGGRVLRREINGQLGGVRDSVAASEAELLVLLNNDVERTRAGWLTRLAAAVEPGVFCGHEARVELGIRYLDGWCLAVCRADWERLGGYDPEFEEPPYWADVDLSWRAARAGLALRAVDVGLVHHTSSSIRAFRRDPWFRALLRRNREHLLGKLEAAGVALARPPSFPVEGGRGCRPARLP